MALEAQDALYVETLVTALHEEIQNKQTIQRADLPPEHPPLSQTELATGVKVMIVDDDPAWLRALPQLLHPWGFQLTTLADPEHFWPVLTAIDPDLLVLEINLQQMNGLNLCQALRQDPHWQRLAVVCLSNSSSPRLQQQAFMMGADDYLCKPVSGFDLANRILNRLQRVRAWMS
jgi:DNA-binding response OmpR family regulator